MWIKLVLFIAYLHSGGLDCYYWLYSYIGYTMLLQIDWLCYCRLQNNRNTTLAECCFITRLHQHYQPIDNDAICPQKRMEMLADCTCIILWMLGSSSFLGATTAVLHHQIHTYCNTLLSLLIPIPVGFVFFFSFSFFHDAQYTNAKRCKSRWVWLLCTIGRGSFCYYCLS